MVLGAVLDAGVALKDINDALAKLDAGGLRLSRSSGQRGGVTGTQVTVHTGDGPSQRSWDFQRFMDMTRRSDLSPSVIERSCTVFQRLAEAESTVHRTASNGPSHLEELGDLDTLADVVGGVAGLDLLGVDRLYSSSLPSGAGVTASEHGKLPALAPATAALLAMARAPVVAPPGNAPDAGEMVTPTGAAIVTTLATFRQPAMNLETIGYGLGSRGSSHYPNVLALWLGSETDTFSTTDLVLVETNIDDMSAELLAYVQERLFEMGARDVWFTPIQMKKSRPGTMLSALLPADLESRAATLVLRETTTLGVRVRPVSRYEAEREVVQVETSLGAVAVKVKRLDGVGVAVSPEYEDCRRIADEQGTPLQEVYRVVQNEASEKLLSG